MNKIYSDGYKGRVIFTRKEKFRIDVFNVLLDKLGTELDKRNNFYKNPKFKFKFLKNLRKNDSTIVIGEELHSKCIYFKNYLDIVFFIKQFHRTLKC